jgi:hypothetical protein
VTTYYGHKKVRETENEKHKITEEWTKWTKKAGTENSTRGFLK